jgi:hypothetical protein
MAAVVHRGSSPNSSPTPSTGTAGLEHGTHIGGRAMWAFYRQPMPRCTVAACARESQGAALRSRAVSLAHPSVALSTLSARSHSLLAPGSISRRLMRSRTHPDAWTLKGELSPTVPSPLRGSETPHGAAGTSGVTCRSRLVPEGSGWATTSASRPSWRARGRGGSSFSHQMMSRLIRSGTRTSRDGPFEA